MALSSQALEQKISFSTKAETLSRLKNSLNNAVILPLYFFSVNDWHKNREKVIDEILSCDWGATKLIVRSSAFSEDQEGMSRAGCYLSVLNVSGREQLIDSIEKVIASYEVTSLQDQVLVQPMLENVKISGVAFGCDPNSSSPYIIINYDASSETDTVTSGSKNISTYVHYQDAKVENSNEFSSIVKLMQELFFLFNTAHIDIEFGLNNQGELYLFQARPLKVQLNSLVNREEHFSALSRIHEFVTSHIKPHPYLYGKSTLYGVMPDWNPAEIIGVRPRKLALSLYRDLVTDTVWAYQRDNYGYSNLRSFPLLVDFEGLPYIDVRVSFNSFLPKGLSPNTSEKLVNYYLDSLSENPRLHDKVEFDIVFSSYTFDMKSRLNNLLNVGFNNEEINEISTSLVHLTNAIISQEHGLWRADLEKIHELEIRQKNLLNGNLDSISKMYWLLEDCKRYGTLPFAGLARAGFVAIQILKSLVNVGVFTDENYTDFLLSVDTVSTKMSHDFNALTKEDFLRQYGHLRPGTYDITSYRYDEKPDQYFNWQSDLNEVVSPHKKSDFRLSITQLRALEEYIHRDGLTITALELLEFIKVAIESREYSKFVFSKSISEFLKLLESYCDQYGLTREDCSYLDLKVVMNLYSSSVDAGKRLSESILDGKFAHQVTKMINLPPLIQTPEEVWSYIYPETSPNFITHLSVTGDVAFAISGNNELDNKIVFIESADPGYDWLFSHKIAAFITKFGGANSHMAIRAGELGIPAIIGVGEVRYSLWSEADRLNIDCLNQQVHIL